MEQQYPPQLNEIPNLRDITCQGSESGDGSAEGSGEGSGEGSAEASTEEYTEGSASGGAEGFTEEVGEFTCSTGRNITEWNVCDGEKDCPGRGEDESYEACYQILKEYDDEPHKLCATIFEGNELVPQFPCFKTGHCIASKLVK